MLDRLYIFPVQQMATAMFRDDHRAGHGSYKAGSGARTTDPSQKTVAAYERLQSRQKRLAACFLRPNQHPSKANTPPQDPSVLERSNERIVVVSR